jgi:hypothetical protein
MTALTQTDLEQTPEDSETDLNPQDQMSTNLEQTPEDSETDLNPQDQMSTSSSDSTYVPPTDETSFSSDDDFSVDASEDLSLIYNDPPLAPDCFDITNFEAILSQQAFLQFQQLDHKVTTEVPSDRHDEFKQLLTNAVQTNQDPANLEHIVQGWMSNHHP